MRAVIIENNIVTNTILVDDINFLPNLIESDIAQIGDIYDNVLHTFKKNNEKNIDQLNAEARNYRDALLSTSDWTILPDSPLSPESQLKWKIYRQNLRDITKQSEFPTTIDWPKLQ